MTSRKRIISFCLLSSLLLVIIFHRILLSFLMTWSLQAYATSYWGKPFQFEKVYFQNKQLVISNFQFEHEFSLTVKQLILTFHFDWWKRHLYINLAMEQPVWHLQAPSMPSWKDWENKWTRRDKWIKVYSSFHIDQGQLNWILDHQSHQLIFDLETNHRKEGYAKLAFDPQNTSHGYLALQTLSNSQEMKIHCMCQKVNCSSLVYLAHYLGMQPLPFKVTNGILQGELEAVLPKAQRPYFQGEIKVENLEFHQVSAPLTGRVEEAILKLEKNSSVQSLAEGISHCMSRIEILKPASLTYTNPTHTWTINQILGNIQLNHTGVALIAIEGQANHLQDTSQWILQGTANTQHLLNLEVSLFFSSLEQPEGKIQIVLYPSEQQHKHTEIQIKKLAYKECKFLQALLTTYWPTLHEIQLEQGVFNARIEADVMNHKIQEIHIKEFQVFDFCSTMKFENAKYYFKKIYGQGKIPLKEKNIFKNLKLELHLEDGEIRLEEINPLLSLTAIQAHFTLENGCIQHSLMTLQLAGLKGVMDIEWGEQKRLLTLKLDGTMQDVAEFFPGHIQDVFHQNFSQNRLLILANIKKQHRQLEFGGTLHIQKANAELMDVIHFGCELKKLPIENSFKFVPTGWFYAHHLPLDKFLSPFIFRRGSAYMKGEAEVKGTFNDQSIIINYDAENVQIENDRLCIEAKELHAKVPGELLGFHHIDLKTYSHHGTLPIEQASYFEKSSGLLFQNIQGRVTFKDQTLHIDPLEAYCEGVYFAGNLALDYSDPAPQVFSLTVQCPTVSGKISQIQHLLAHLEQPSLLQKIPLEGEVTMKEQGLYAHFDFIPEDYSVQADIRGVISEGSLPLDNSEMSLKGMYMDVAYHHQNQTLEFNDIQGTLLVGKPRYVEEYFFNGHHIYFHSLKNPTIDLDIAIKDHQVELARLVAYTQNEETNIKRIYLDQKQSHVSAIYPDHWKCTLKNWTEINQFEIHSQFDIHNLLEDIKRFQKTGLPFLSHYIIDKFVHLSPIKGQTSLSILYHPDDQSYDYQVEIPHLKHKNHEECSGLLKGRKQGKKWMLDHCQWGHWNLYAEFQHHDDKWKIPFLGLKGGQAFLIGLEGEIIPADHLFRAKLNLLEVDLERLSGLDNFQSFIAKWIPKGHLKAMGEMEWNFETSDGLSGLTMHLMTHLNTLNIRNYPIQILQPFQIELQPNKIVCIKNCPLNLSASTDQTQINMQQLSYELSEKGLQSLQLNFQIPYLQLKEIGETFHHHFPDILNTSFKDTLVAVKSSGSLTGLLKVEKTATQNLMFLKLEDGQYRFKNQEYDFHELEIKINNNDLHFSALSNQERCLFRIIGQSDWPVCQQGSCTIIDILESSSIKSYKPLFIHWNHHPLQGFGIRSMQGNFCGCSFQLGEEPEYTQEKERPTLKGQVIIDFNRLAPALTYNIANTIQNLKIASPYIFNGHVWMNSDLGNTLLETLFFKGHIKNLEAVLKGYQFEKIESDIQYQPGHLDMQNFSIEDISGSAYIANLAVIYDQLLDQWSLLIPRLVVKNWRPSLLRSIETPSHTNAKYRSLMIKRLEFQNFSGELNHIPTWQAEGYLHFLNPSRKNFSHPLLAIPAEIILRLGLDPQVLNPVTGTLCFNLQGDHLYFTRFKDVYSEGRGSKFYLANTSNPSWMDLEGNLFLQIRMKQYNLIFKIAELFTVSIQGTIKKPHYTLQKQIK